MTHSTKYAARYQAHTYTQWRCTLYMYVLYASHFEWQEWMQYGALMSSTRFCILRNGLQLISVQMPMLGSEFEKFVYLIITWQIFCDSRRCLQKNHHFKCNILMYLRSSVRNDYNQWISNSFVAPVMERIWWIQWNQLFEIMRYFDYFFLSFFLFCNDPAAIVLTHTPEFLSL